MLSRERKREIRIELNENYESWKSDYSSQDEKKRYVSEWNKIFGSKFKLVNMIWCLTIRVKHQTHHEINQMEARVTSTYRGYRG